MRFLFFSTFLKKGLLVFTLILLGCAHWQKTTGAKNNSTPVDTHGQLKIVDGKIVNRKGKSVQLKGMSYFWSQWMGGFYNAETVKWLKDDWRCTVVRAAMGIESGGYLQNKEREKAKVIAVVEGAIKEGLYVIIDWHDHRAEQHLEESKTFFSEMAQRFGKYPNVIYEIYNEPLNVSWSGVIKPYSEEVIKAIRTYDPDNIIVCGTRTWSQRVDEAAADPIKGVNIAYTLHYYAGTHKQNLRDIATKALNKGIALMVTEFGTTNANGNGNVDEQESELWWKFLDQHQISWCNWSVATKNETSAALKRGASLNGGWKEDEISVSGLLVRKKLAEKTNFN